MFQRWKGLAAALSVGVWVTPAAGVAQTAGQPSQPPTGQTPTAQTPSTPPAAVTYTVDVIETLPLPAVNLTIEQIPAPVQAAAAADIDASGALDLSDFLNRRFAGVFVNETQGNPFQPDLNYRGYTASPLLGTPQGLSVYLDGVRLNQPFGDVVSWDLIPRVAIGSTTLMPGSNPLFGLNTLGGALAIQTKDGRTSAGHDRSAPSTAAVSAVPSRSSRAVARERTALVCGRQPLRRGRLARCLAVERRPGVRQTRLAHGKDRFSALGRIRRQFADRERTPGAAVSGPRLRQHLHEAGRDRQPRDVREPHHPARSAATR